MQWKLWFKVVRLIRPKIVQPELVIDRDSIYLDLINRRIKSFEKSISELSSNKDTLNSDILIDSIKKYLKKQCDLFVLPSVCFEINLRRLRQELKGETSQQRYSSYFVLYNHFAKYPVLKGLLEQFIDSTLKGLQVMLGNIDSDWQKIQTTFLIGQNDTLVSVEISNNSDRHTQSMQTVILCFSSGLKILYKPTGLHNENLIRDLQIFINNNLQEEQLKPYRYLESGDRVYREFIEYDGRIDSETEADNFYFQIGLFIGLCFLTSGTDMHMENILVNAGSLYFIDRETFFHHNELIGFPNYPDIFSIGLLQNPQLINESYKEVSGIVGGEGNRQSLTMPIVENDQTDMVFVKYIGLSKFKQHNRIFSKDKQIIAPRAHSTAIIRGFKEVSQLFYQHKSQIIEIVGSYNQARARQIVRKTAVYAAIIRQIFQPKNLINKNYKSEVRNLLFSGYGAYHNRSTQLAEYETDELFNLNIPYFYTSIHRNSIFCGNGYEFEKFFDKSAFEIFKDIIYKLDDKLIQDTSAELIKSLIVPPH